MRAEKIPLDLIAFVELDLRLDLIAQSPEKPNIHLLLAAPSGEQRKAYDHAKDLLHASGAVNLIEEDQAMDFARDLESRIATAGLAQG